MSNVSQLLRRYLGIAVLFPFVLLTGCGNSSSSPSLSYRVISAGDSNTGLAAEEVELSNVSDQAVGDQGGFDDGEAVFTLTVGAILGITAVNSEWKQ